MPTYLADTSVWAWAKRSKRLATKLKERLERAELATTVPVALELLHSSRDGGEYEDDLAVLLPLAWLPVTETVADRALDVQRQLAQTTHGAHRLPAIDYLLAAISEEAGAVLWHVDSDVARVCDFTGQWQEHERVSARRK